jgi:hypothetical protein
MWEVVCPHQSLAQSKGRKLSFKLISEMYIFLRSANPKLLSQIEVNSRDIYTFSKSIMLAVGSHCECSTGTLKNLPTPLLSGVKMKEKYLVLTMLVNRRVAAVTLLKMCLLGWWQSC